MKTISIKITDDNDVEVKTSGLDYQQFLQVVLTAIEGAADTVIKAAKKHVDEVPDIEQQCRDEPSS